MNTKANKPRVISEIGCNHMGSMEIAKDLINLSKACGAFAAKFQKRNPRELLTKEQYDAPHPNPMHSYGKTYGEHREHLEFNIDQHKQLKQHCELVGIEYSTSVWDVSSAKEILGLKPSFIKIPSACNNNEELLRILRDDYKGEVHVSTGMTSSMEIEAIVTFFEDAGQARDRLTVYSCTSGYPVPFEDVCLLEISKLKERYSDRVAGIAFSGHHLGIAIDIAAYALGASTIERHFTKDRTWKGTDHSASLEPSGLQKLCRDLNATYLALSTKKAEILPIEIVQREKLKYRSKKAA